MLFKNLTINDKALFDSCLQPYSFATHEYNFTNLFLWKNYCRIQYAEIRDVLVLKKKDYVSEDVFFMQPLNYRKEELPALVERLSVYALAHGHSDLFRDVELPLVRHLQEAFPERFEIECQPGSSDYLYETDSFVHLHGNKFRAHKNHINHFLKHNHSSVLPLTSEHEEECVRFAKQWCADKKANGSLSSESEALEDLFAHRDSLGYTGMIIRVDDVLAAFIIGEKLNPETAVIHIEKASAHIKGLYNYLKKIFVERYFYDTRYINWEQDLGIPGLRKAKMSYRPCRLEHKYTVREKQRI